MPLWKRTLDLICVALSLPILVPLAGMISLIIKAVSKGPLLFRQVRIGQFGKPFICFKFRSLRADAETRSHEDHVKRLMQSDAPMVKLDAGGDNRVIPFGRILRASGLDELPQLINVIRGEMSLVGPRPCTPVEYQLYTPEQRKRFEAVPGLTGWWQVNGKNNTTFNEMISLDIQYVAACSLGLDLRILARTVSVVLAQVGELKQRTTTTLSREKTS